ncbi:unnamed protein product [Somion occarium]|uniref:Shugoshin C-terminal domain-containing protein n=1 Tax=Somion occarium TaxID=3059160 RepID=A0ABP1D5G2_9APHY
MFARTTPCWNSKIKKFLLANKHITKLNSTLSIRIEELNAQISGLYVENLRLRASEIALSAQLKKEREKSRKILADAEAATHSFMKQLGYIRKANNISPGRSKTPESQHAPVPRARRPIINPDSTPPVNRIARPPTVPGIIEGDETNLSSPDSPGADPEDEDEPPSPTPVRRKSKARASSSRLPLPTPRIASPDPPLSIDLPTVNFAEQLKAGKRKPTRRQSGLLTTSVSITTVTERPPSPAFGSPLRRDAALEEEEEEVLAVIGGIDGQDDDEPEIITQRITRRERKKKSREKETEKESGGEGSTKERERKRSRDSEEQTWTVEGGKKSKLKDVTNSPPSRLPALDIPSSDRERLHTPEHEIPTSATSATTSSSLATTRTFLTTPATTPAPSLKSEHQSQLVTPRSSSPAPDSEPAGGRERRARKSVNYAEPKLNTKMRKPDPQPSSSKRASTSSLGPDAPRRSLEGAPPIPSSSSTDNTAMTQPQPVAGVKRKKSLRVHVLSEDGEESEGTQADAEYGGLRVSASSWVNTDGRRRSIHTGSSRDPKRLEGDDGRRHSMAV